jgi:benzoylformate decarboxylase
MTFETGPAGNQDGVTVRDAVLRLLRSFGMQRIFGNPGSTELPLFLDFPRDFEYVLGLQESVVVGMADGFATATKNAAFVNLHSAVGVGHAMGAIFTAWKNRTPLVITAGQQARSLFPFDPFLFSASAIELPKPYVKWSCEPARAEDVPAAIARAYYPAMQPPQGPVLVSIPADDWARPCDPIEPRRIGSAPRCDAEVLRAIGDALDRSERPTIVVGAGVDRGGAWDEVRTLAERHRARVFTAPMSARCGFAEDHPQFAGFLPAMREKIVASLAGSDLVLVLGAPAFTYHVEGHGPHVPAGAELCQITDDPEVAARTPVGTAAVGDLRAAVLELLERPPPRDRVAPPGRVARPRAQPSTPMSVAFALETLAEVRRPEDIVVEEAPSSRPVMHCHLPMLRSETFYTMASGGLGFGLPAAVGIALARPQARVVGLVGDGSAMYSIQALWSAAQLKLPMTFIILNNRRYAALQEFAPTCGFVAGAKLQGTDLSGLDFVAMAKGMGVVDATRVERPDALRGLLESALRSPAPALLEIAVA